MADEDDNGILEALRGEDALGVVIRAHTYLESRLIRILEKQVVNKSALNKMNLSYARRVHLAIALGMKNSYGPFFLSLGKLRNEFAHNLDTHITKDRIDNLFDSLSPHEKEMLNDSLATIMKNDQAEPVPFTSLSPRNQFILMVVGFMGFLDAYEKGISALALHTRVAKTSD